MTQLTHSSPRFYLTSVHHVILRLIVGLLIATLCLWAFGALAEDVTTHERIVQIDQAIADGLHQLATQYGELHRYQHSGAASRFSVGRCYDDRIPGQS